MLPVANIQDVGAEFTGAIDGSPFLRRAREDLELCQRVEPAAQELAVDRDDDPLLRMALNE